MSIAIDINSRTMRATVAAANFCMICYEGKNSEY